VFKFSLCLMLLLIGFVFVSIADVIIRCKVCWFNNSSVCLMETFGFVHRLHGFRIVDLIRSFNLHLPIEAEKRRKIDCGHVLSSLFCNIRNDTFICF